MVAVRGGRRGGGGEKEEGGEAHCVIGLGRCWAEIEVGLGGCYWG